MDSGKFETLISWRERPFQSMRQSSSILGVSVATLYKMAGRRDLQLKRFGGRTLIETSELLRLIDRVENWSPSMRTVQATAARRSTRDHLSDAAQS